MRSCLIEVVNVLGDNLQKMVVIYNDDKVQTLAPQAAYESFANGVGFGRCDGRTNDLDSCPGCGSIKLTAIFFVIVANKKLGTFAKGRSFSQLLRNPQLGRMTGHADMNNPT